MECGQKLEIGTYFYLEKLFGGAVVTPSLLLLPVRLKIIVLLLTREAPKRPTSWARVPAGVAILAADLRTPLETGHFKVVWRLRNTNKAFNPESLPLSQGTIVHSSTEKRCRKHSPQPHNTSLFAFFFFFFSISMSYFWIAFQDRTERYCLPFTHFPQRLHLTYL